MSVGEEQTECPLCMEPLEMDDINFFPCTCGYQICRFCWHRIRTDENGLCPACRKQYPEDPAEFKPLTEDELQRIKKERRQKDLQRKQKAAENRKHLANVRVVQKNLVFVVGLSQRLADPEVLKRHDYFGKFGKIHKVVINQSTSYAGAQGPSASAYVTYNRPEDALKAIQAVNHIHVDGRTLKASLGTTKYCSHFLRGAQCPKPDCMYLHELGEEAASFTKEEMQQGKHQEYEQKLYEQYMNCQNLTNHHAPAASTSTTTTTSTSSSKAQSRKKNISPPTIQSSSSGGQPAQNSTNKEAWPCLQEAGNGSGGGSSTTTSSSSSSRPERLTNGNKSPHPPLGQTTTQNTDTTNAQSRAPGHHRNRSLSEDTEQIIGKTSDTSPLGASPNTRGSGPPVTPHTTTQSASQPPQDTPPAPTQIPPHQPPPLPQQQHSPLGTTRKSPFENPADSLSLFSNGFPPTNRNPKPQPQHAESITSPEIPDTIPVSSTTDWQAAFGFTSTATPTSTSSNTEPQEDDLGFDPWDESSRALQDLIEKESHMGPYIPSPQQQHHHTQPQPAPHPHHHHHHHHQGNFQQVPDNRPKNLPPGFSQIGAYNGNIHRPGVAGSKMMGLMQFPVIPPNMHTHNHNTYHDVLSDIHVPPLGKDSLHTSSQQNDVFNMKDWQDGLRALLPNINISFGAPGGHPAAGTTTTRTPQTHTAPQKNWSSQSQGAPELSWDPAIVTSGNITDSLSESPPHWMASLQHLTDESTNHRLPFVHQFQLRGPTWPPQTQHPPPGFQSQIRPPTQVPEAHKLTEGLQ